MPRTIKIYSSNMGALTKCPNVRSTSSNDCPVRHIYGVGPNKATFNPGLSRGSVTGIEGTKGICGAILGSNVAPERVMLKIGDVEVPVALGFRGR